ncbi:MAG: pyridoxamine 5'-phosphate oxidase family protein [Candidatus Liptonbacteria bacterium]|nr:pyridoxamine 5'-phosphate oxidase family protein [Candidatus Liptonbacteria bacterium]
MQNIDWNKEIKEALDRTEFMALSSVNNGESWTNPVAFAYSETMELFFISMMDAKHSQNILANPNVSVAIFKTERFPSGDVIGLQLKGQAKHLTEISEIQKAAKYYFGRSPGNEEFRQKTSESGGSGALWQFFKITPTELWCFDSRIFGEERKKVDLSTLVLDFRN